MLIEDFDYHLPKKLIAQHPTHPRDACRLMVVENGHITHCLFQDIHRFFQPGDVLVLNNTRVIPARLHGHKATGGKIELLLLGKENGFFRCLIKGRVRKGTTLLFQGITGTIHEKRGSEYLVDFPVDEHHLKHRGEIPLPPYIKERVPPDLYQTVYTDKKGSVASPTAGLHFTHGLLKQLQQQGVSLVFVTLHIGIGTFLPVREQDVTRHLMEAEQYEVTHGAADVINNALRKGHRVVAVGTTCVKTLETVTQKKVVTPGKGWSDLFIYPGYTFHFPYKGLVTNFHLPKSTLFMLVCAFAGTETMKKAYRVAIKNNYRFFSFGDAMLILDHHV